jgi:hypothetical protein
MGKVFLLGLMGISLVVNGVMVNLNLEFCLKLMALNGKSQFEQSLLVNIKT